MRTLNESINIEIERFISNFIEAKGYAPTIDEISGSLCYPKTTVHRYVSRMRENGVLQYGGHRSLTFVKTKNEFVRVPVLGKVSCGLPKYAQENITEYVKLPVSLFGRGDFFILYANGDSMVNAGIEDKDMVLIRQQNYAEPGQIVVALVGDEATLKRFYPDKENKCIRLHPENSKMEDIVTDGCIIQGVAVSVLKNLE